MKRLIAAIISVCLMLTVFVGCGGDTASSATESTARSGEAAESSAAEAAADQNAAEEPVEAAEETGSAEDAEAAEESAMEEAVVYEPIAYPLDTTESFSWFMSYPGVMELFVSEPFYDYEAWNEWQRRTGVSIDWYLVSGFDTMTEQFNLMLASGDYTDVFMSTLSTVSSVDELIDQEIIFDLKDIIPENMPDYMAYIAENEEFASSIGTESSEGHWGGLHTYTENTYASSGLVIRSDWLDTVGMDVPTTYDELYEALKLFKSGVGADSALWINYNGYLPNNGLIAGFDTMAASDSSTYPFYQVDGEVVYGSTSEGFKAYIKLLAQWYSEGLIYHDFMSYTDSNTQPPSDLVTNNQCGVYAQTLDSFHQWDDSSDSFEVVALPDIRQTADQTLHFSDENDGASSSVLCVSTSCDNVETVLRAFNYDFTEEGYILMNYGIENETFVFDENGEPQLTDVVLKSELPDVSLAFSVFTGTDANAYCGIRDDGRGWALFDEAQQAACEVWENEGDDKAYVYPALCSMSLEESTVFNSKITDITTYVSEKTLSWIVGTADVEADWDAYVANIETMGIQDCINAKQMALDRYYAQRIS